MLMQPELVKKEWFTDAFALHFCSVSLGDFPMKRAHEKAIAYAKEAGNIISFDPNLRLALWENEEELREAVLAFLPMANILKISDEEIAFLTGKTSVEDAWEQLFVGDVQMVIYTKGADGAECYTRTNRAEAAGCKVKATDTTGAGDAFIGSFLYQLAADGVSAENLSAVSAEDMEKYMTFSNRYCAKSVQKTGAIASYPTLDEMME